MIWLINQIALIAAFVFVVPLLVGLLILWAATLVGLVVFPFAFAWQLLSLGWALVRRPRNAH